MPYTDFPNGITSFGIPAVGSGAIPVTNGAYFFVCNNSGANGSDGNDGLSMQTPFATLAYALTKCTSGNSDVVVVMAGHAENIASATALGFSVQGVSIVGLGNGVLRPTFTFTTANTATIAVSAGSIKISNCIFIGNFLSIASCFTLAAAPNFWVDNCNFRDTSAILGFLSIITTTVSVNANGLTFTNNTVQSDATTTPGPAIVILGTMDRLTISGNFVTHSTISNNVAALLSHAALVVSHLYMAYNQVYSVNTDTATGGLLLTTTATTGSGMIFNNYAAALDTAAAILLPAIAVQYGCFNNYYAHRGNSTSGYLLPAAGTD